MNKALTRRSFVGVAGGILGAATTATTLAGAKAVAVASEPVPTEGTSPAVRDELLDYDAVGLAELIRNKQVSPSELVQATARRIARLDGAINAMTTLTIDKALARADSIPSYSAFAGVPTVLKDLIDVAGVRRTSGSRLHLSHVPKKSVAYIKAMEAAGLNFAGMTNTPEFASMAVTDNHAFGPSRNPWNLDHTPGGSSGGSAAAVAAGYVPIAHGTDGGGSNRLPASCCGLLGMKASRYRMVSGEADGGHPFLRTHQCISRTVRDSAALFAVTENRAADAPYEPLGLVEGASSRRLRIGLTTMNFFGSETNASVKAAIEDTAKLCNSLGHKVIEVKNPLDGEQFFYALESVMLAGMPALLSMVESLTGKPAEKSGLLTPMMVATGRYAAELPADAYDKGLAYLEGVIVEMEKFHKRIDVWLTPVMPKEPPRIGEFSPDFLFLDTRQRTQDLMSYTPIANAIGAPAMSVPLSWSSASGLPIGSHFLAKPGDDKTLYELAFELEAARPWANKWAPFSARYVA